MRIPFGLETRAIVPLPENSPFTFYKKKGGFLSKEVQKAITDWWDSEPRSEFNGVVYGAKLVPQWSKRWFYWCLQQIVVKLWPSSFAHKRCEGQEINGVQIPLLNRANAPVLVKLVNREGKLIGYVFGLHRTGQIIVPGGVLDEKHAASEHPFQANATAELYEELGLNLDEAIQWRFGYWVRDRSMNHFLVIATFEVESVEEFMEKFKGRPEDEMIDFVVVRRPRDLKKLANLLPHYKVWKWALQLLKLERRRSLVDQVKRWTRR